MKPRYSFPRILLIALFFSLFSIAFQVSAFHHFLPRLFVPNLFVLLVVRVAVASPNSAGAIAVFLIGVFADLAEGVLIGPWACAFLLVFLGLIVISERIFIDSPLGTLVVGFAAALAAGIVYYVLSWQFVPELAVSSLVLLSQSFATALCGPIVLPLLRKYLREKSDTQTAFTA